MKGREKRKERENKENKEQRQRAKTWQDEDKFLEHVQSKKLKALQDL